MNNAMWPGEITQVQQKMDQARSEVTSAISRQAVEVVLRPARRCIDKSLAHIVKKFALPPGKSVLPHLNEPFFASQSWFLVKPWLMKKSGPQAVYDFALSAREAILRESMLPQYEGNALSDVYQCLFELYDQHADRLTPLNPLLDWAKAALASMPDLSNSHMSSFDPLTQKQTLLELTGLIKDTGFSTDEGLSALLHLSAPANKLMPSFFLRSQKLIDLLLFCGVPWQKVIDELPSPAQEFILTHPASRRARLNELAGQPNPGSPLRPAM